MATRTTLGLSQRLFSWTKASDRFPNSRCLNPPTQTCPHWSPFRRQKRSGVILYNSVSKMYNQSVAKVTMSEGRERLSEMVDVARNEAVVFERYGRPAAVMISADRYEEMMEALEEIEDISAFDAAMSEEGANIPWEQVKQDLGWT